MLLATAAAVTGDQRDWACLYGSVWGTLPDPLQRALDGMHMAQQQQQLSGSWGLAKYGHPGQRCAIHLEAQPPNNSNQQKHVQRGLHPKLLHLLLLAGSYSCSHSISTATVSRGQTSEYEL
jgi:hypothetical protein